MVPEAYANRGFWLKRFSWARDQDDIENSRKKFQKAQQLLQLALTHRRPSYYEPPQPTASAGASVDLHQQVSLDSGYGSSISQGTQASSSTAADRGIEEQRLWYPALPNATPAMASTDYERPQVSLREERPHSMGLKANREKHKLVQDIRLKFEEAAKSIGAGVDLDTLLCLATWWHLKSRALWHNLTRRDVQGKSRTDNIFQHGWRSSLSLEQASADLLKSSFILEGLVLAKDPLGTHISDITWTSLKTLADAIDFDLRYRRLSPFLRLIEDSRLLDQDLDLTEKLISAAEHPNHLPEVLDDFESPQRWITTDLDHAGNEKEKVLFRTFVDAELGSNSVKSFNAPYLLLLFCHEGRSELYVSLCNQITSLNLMRRMSRQDLTLLEECIRGDGGLQLNFPNQRTIVKFLSSHERDTFLSWPQKFFSAMKPRTSRAGEILIFREGLKSYESQDVVANTHLTSADRHMNETHSACEVSLYDFSPDEGWKSTRRLVISSDPSVPEPWCTSHWLPLSRVQVQAQGRVVVLIWSDYKQLEKKSNGQYGYWWSYVYDPDHPNCSVTIVFEDTQHAEAFAMSILHPFEAPFKSPYANLIANFESASAMQDVRVYELSDLDGTFSEGCHAIVSVSRRPNMCQVSEVYFAYRDFDFAIENGTHPSVEFPSLIVPHYVSSITDVSVNPEEGPGQIALQEVKSTSRPARLEFSHRENMEDFMERILSWKLKFCREAYLVSLSHKSAFSKTRKNAAVYVFEKSTRAEKPAKIRLAIRTLQDDAPQWITASLSGSHRTVDGPAQSKVVFKDIKIQRGNEIDSKALRANDSSSRDQQQAHPERRWKITIIFKDGRDSRDFMNQWRMALADWPNPAGFTEP